jgi:hypothetical protein
MEFKRPALFFEEYLGFTPKLEEYPMVHDRNSAAGNN